VNSSNDIPDCLAKTPYVMAIGIYPNIIGKPTAKPFLIISIDWFVFCVVACDCPIKALPPFCVEKFKLLYHITKMNNRWKIYVFILHWYQEKKLVVLLLICG